LARKKLKANDDRIGKHRPRKLALYTQITLDFITVISLLAGKEEGEDEEEEEQEEVGQFALEQEASRARLQEVEDQQQQRRDDLGGYILSLKACSKRHILSM